MKIGIDIGGMSVKAGLVDGNSIIKTASLPTIKNDAQAMCQTIDQLISMCCEDRSLLSGIGIGIPGVVDGDRVLWANNIGWKDVPFAQMLSERVNLPVKLGNDAYCALLAELTYGAGAGSENVLMVTLGTGVGVKACVNGKLILGNQSCGMEAGHFKIHDKDQRGYSCACGIEGCWEGYASTSALIAKTANYVEDNPNSVAAQLAKESGVNGMLIFEAAKQGDMGARLVIDGHMQDILDGMISLCNIFRPEILIVGGGICERFYLFENLGEELNRKIYGRPITPSVRLVRAMMGNGAGIIGSALL